VVGYATDAVASHWGQEVRWEFGTLMLYNGSKGAVVHELELVALTGVIQQLPQGDPYYSNVKLLLHMDGTSGSTTFVDNSPVNYTMTAVGDTKVNTTTVKFGTGSLESDGSGDYLVIDYPNQGFISAAATTPWTAEIWVYSAAANPSIRWNSASASEFSLGFFDGSIFPDYLLRPFTGPNLSTTNYPISPNQWAFVAVVNDPATSLMYLYINGVAVATQPNKQMATMCYVSGPSPISFNGFIDDVRITVGVARYAGNFTPPVEAFPNYPSTNGTPQISTSYSLDGKSWSQDHFISAGGPGETRKRLVWRRQGFMRNFRVQRFRGTSAAKISFLRLEAQVEALAY